MRSIPEVTLHIRLRQPDGTRRYELVNRKKPQTGGVYCLHYYTPDGQRKWEAVGSDLNKAVAARLAKEQGLLEDHSSPKPSSILEQTLEEQRTAFILDRETTFKHSNRTVRRWTPILSHTTSR